MGNYTISIPNGSDALAEFYLFALAVYREASGEPYEGKLAVAHVIANRAARPRWWGSDICSVILARQQFSSFNAPTDDGNKATKDYDPGIMRYPVRGDKAWNDCTNVVAEVLLGSKDNTYGSDHYHAKSVSPPWAAGKTPRVTIGNHIFYRLEE